jgi:hypothetical protein
MGVYHYDYLSLSKEVPMSMKLKKFLKGTMFVLAGGLYVLVLGGFVNPNLNDSGHAIGMLSASGGSARHPVEYDLNEAILGRFTLMLTAKVLPPVSGDLAVHLIGPEKLDYVVSTRYPPGVPLFNRRDGWYTFEDSTFKGVTPGSDLVIVLRIKPPKDIGRYTLVISDDLTGKLYFTMPVIFSKDGVLPAEGEDCH